MAVQQHVLNWLYSVLTSEYHDVNRTYNDVAQALSQYPSLSPRTDVHTFDNGVSALLLHLSGTIPVVFRGATYRFPISIWVPHAYPREAPLAYVTPTDNMMVRPGQHVDPQGRIYHPYLAAWPEFWDKSSLLDFLAILRDIFAKEPPVVAKQQVRPPAVQQQPQQHTPSPNPPPPVPPLPPDMSRRQTPLQQQFGTPQPQAGGGVGRPPPPPPKGDDFPQVVSGPSAGTPGPPPLPPLPPGVHRESVQQQFSPHAPPLSTPNPNRLSRYDTAPPLPPQQQTQQQHQSPQTYQQPQPPPPHVQYHPQQQQLQQQPQQHSYSPSGPSLSSVQQQQGFSPSDSRRTSIVSLGTPYNVVGAPGPPGPPGAPTGPPPPQWQQYHHPQPQPYHPHQQQQQFAPPLAAQPQPKPKPPPPPDIMDEPLSPPSPPPNNNNNNNNNGNNDPSHPPQAGAPPPRPPNPEKDALLRQLGSTLHELRQRARQQNEALLGNLATQRAALLSARQALQADSAALAPLSALLANNTQILQQSLREADRVIDEQTQEVSNAQTGEMGPQRRPKPPPFAIDDLLVAPTVVGNQLYDAVAEERALGDAIFVLGRAVERGRLAPAVFARTTRSLAREWYLKKALVRKIGRGMGLVG